MKKQKGSAVYQIAIFVVALFVLWFIAAPFQFEPAYAQTEIEKLQSKITDHGNRLKEIEKEISSYKTELQKVGSEKNTLQSAINKLELERKKVQADISYTQNKIGSTDLEINKLALEISDVEDSISVNKQAISETLKSLYEIEDISFIEMLLQNQNLSEFWGQIDELEQIRGVIANEVTKLVSHKTLLEEKHGDSTEKRAELVELKEQYDDQNIILTENKKEKNELLSVTKNEEANYQKLLKEKEVLKEQLLKEMRDFESQLQFILDPNSIPKKGTQVFNWPVDNVIITQLFGGTEFAKRNASVYGGRPYHSGVDFGVPVGTKIHAPLSGTVRAIGNTDLVSGCYSWGKWILIDHANGLSTLYAHLSQHAVSPGDKVQTGAVIAYSGNTGYSTGPHLHFTVYTKDGVSVRKFNEIKSVTSCGAASTPVAATDAYIDPMDYLPQ